MNQKLKIRLRRAVARIKKFREEHPKALKVAMAAVVVLALYAVSKSTETVTKVLHVAREGEFKVSRIFNGSEEAVNAAKGKSFERTAGEILTSQKKLTEEVQKVGKRVDVIEAKLKQGESGAQGSAGAANGAATATTGAMAANGGAAASQTGQAAALQRGQSYPSEYVRPQGNSPYTGGTSPVGLMAGSQRVAARGPDVITFPVASEEPKEELGIVLPVGSYVRAKILAGTDATTGEPDPVLLQLDYSHVLPNQRKIDLSGCFMTAKAQADLSTERVKMKTMKLSCVSKRGLVFEKDVNGYVADDADNKFAVSGEVNSKQDRVAATAFLAGVVEGVGKAIQQAQTTQQATPLGGSQAVMTGDERKYLAGGAAANAASMVASWYLKQAESLLPSITVGSGKDVWVVVLENVNLPKEYFTKGSGHDPRYAYVTRVLD